ncbi:hypothetical protein [Mesorhizobium temperatum]|nr:hypothetical protein [Mesorhizobium temperatum]
MPVRRKKYKRRNVEPDHDTLWNLDLGWRSGERVMQSLRKLFAKLKLL